MAVSPVSATSASRCGRARARTSRPASAASARRRTPAPSRQRPLSPSRVTSPAPASVPSSRETVLALMPARRASSFVPSDAPPAAASASSTATVRSTAAIGLPRLDPGSAIGVGSYAAARAGCRSAHGMCWEVCRLSTPALAVDRRLSRKVCSTDHARLPGLDGRGGRRAGARVRDGRASGSRSRAHARPRPGRRAGARAPARPDLEPGRHRSSLGGHRGRCRARGRRRRSEAVRHRRAAPRRSAAAVAVRIHALGLAVHGRRWLPVDDYRLRLAVEAGDSIDRIAADLERTRESIRHRCRDLGVGKPRPRARHARLPPVDGAGGAAPARAARPAAARRSHAASAAPRP